MGKNHHLQPTKARKWRFQLRTVLRGEEASQLLEFALTLPFLMVFVVGVLDFGEVYNLKQKLNNASREAARFAVGENSGASLSTSDVNALKDVVSNYLTNAGVTQCAISAAPNSVVGFVYTYNSGSVGCGTFALLIDRNYVLTAGGITVAATRVKLTYPFTWSLGKVIGFMLPGSTLTGGGLPASISTESMMQNLN